LDARGFKGLDRLAVCFGRFTVARHATKRLLRQIGREAKAATHVIVEHGLHAHDIGDAVGNRAVDIRAGVGKCPHGVVNVRGFFFGRLEFANECQCLFHSYTYISLLKCVRGEKAVGLRPTTFSSPWLKRGGSKHGENG
jgi:hypothetical protein